MAEGAAGRFTTGSTMRHVAVMTLTGSLGLSFMFLVDFATLFYVSLLGDETLTAAVGFAWGVQFFTISLGIGFAIATTALVSRAIGARERERARRSATAASIITTTLLVLAAAVVIIFRRDILGVIGAEGEAAEVAARFLLISVPSLPFVGMAMITASTLRAEGDARRSMMVTMSGGMAAMALDPLFIFGFGLGVDGAAAAMVLSRMVSGGVGLYFCIRSHNLMAAPSLGETMRFLRPFFAIAGPATATQLSSPVGNLVFTWWIADFGDSAVAGWAVVSRVMVLAFGGIFALSGAVGGIFGQNYGAKLYDRVGMAYRDAMIFAALYVGAAWAILAACAPLIVSGFGVSETGAEVVYAFCYIGAGAFIFTGLIFVSNAAFNNLGRPLWSTWFNWGRDAAVTPLALILMPAAVGAPGGVYAQSIAAVLVGVAAAAVGWRHAHRIAPKQTADEAGWPMPPAAPASGKSAAAILQNEPVKD